MVPLKVDFCLVAEPSPGLSSQPVVMFLRERRKKKKEKQRRRKEELKGGTNLTEGQRAIQKLRKCSQSHTTEPHMDHTFLYTNQMVFLALQSLPTELCVYLPTLTLAGGTKQLERAAHYIRAQQGWPLGTLP